MHVWWSLLFLLVVGRVIAHVHRGEHAWVSNMIPSLSPSGLSMLVTPDCVDPAALSWPPDPVPGGGRRWLGTTNPAPRNPPSRQRCGPASVSQSSNPS